MAAIGVRVTRWVSFHGVALNVCPDMRPFALIRPCGLTRPVTSLQALLRRTPAAGSMADAQREGECGNAGAELAAVQERASLGGPPPMPVPVPQPPPCESPAPSGTVQAGTQGCKASGSKDDVGASGTLHEPVVHGTHLQPQPRHAAALSTSTHPSPSSSSALSRFTELNSTLVAAGQPWHASEEERRLMAVTAQEVLAAFSHVFQVDVERIET